MRMPKLDPDDLSDIFIFGGLVMAGVGLWFSLQWLTLAVIGGILFLLGILPRIKG